MEAKKKQERAIVHLEKDGQHYYYGNLKALCDHWDKDALGVWYAYLRNYGISEGKQALHTISPIEGIPDWF
jgi:hypothetical protein